MDRFFSILFALLATSLLYTLIFNSADASVLLRIFRCFWFVLCVLISAKDNYEANKQKEHSS